MNIVQFIRNPDLINGSLSDYQETLLRLAYGLRLTAKQRTIARHGLATESLSRHVYNEVTAICGRRSGKSDRIAGNIAVFEAAVGGHEKRLAPGERAHIVLIAQDKRAARVLYRYVLAKLENSPMLSQLLQDVRKEEIDLTNRLTISIFPCSFRATRGFSIPVAILDELAFFRVEGVNVDSEVINAIRPAQATFPRSKLIKISTPYAKQGELYRDFANRHKRADLLVFRAASWKMNPSIPKSFLDEERARDPEYFSREYAAEFSDAIASAFSRDAVEACVIPDRYEVPFQAGVRYIAAVDPSGGGRDEFTLSIVHREEDWVVQDCARAYYSKKPKDVVAEMADVLKSYNISTVVGDRYAGEWPRQAFRDKGITYELAPLTASESFLELLPKINQGSVELLDEPRQTAQLIALERRRGRAGKDTLGHPQGAHDDRANALALAVYKAAKHGGEMIVFSGGGRTQETLADNIFTDSIRGKHYAENH